LTFSFLLFFFITQKRKRKKERKKETKKRKRNYQDVTNMMDYPNILQICGDEVFHHLGANI